MCTPRHASEWDRQCRAEDCDQTLDFILLDGPEGCTVHLVNPMLLYSLRYEVPAPPIFDPHSGEWYDTVYVYESLGLGYPVTPTSSVAQRFIYSYRRIVEE